MALNIALSLLLVVICVPGGWSAARNAAAISEEEGYDDDTLSIEPQEQDIVPIHPAHQGFPGFNRTEEMKVVGGTEIRRNTWKFMVLITLKRGDDRVPHCGGTIFTPLHVVTAAHCFDKVGETDLEVVAGEHDFRVSEGKEQRVGVLAIVRHHGYTAGLLHNDVAVLKLSRPLVFDEAVYAMALNFNDKCPRVGDICSAAGWGDTSYPNGQDSPVPLQIDMPATDPSICFTLYPSRFDVNQLCVGGKGQEACYGDSGGPLVCDCDGWKLAGVTSHGTPCGIYGHPTAYTKVSHFYTWIMQQTIL